MSQATCSKGHAFEQNELVLTGWRLPCGCPLTNSESRKAEKMSEVMAAELLAKEKPDPTAQPKVVNPPLQQGMFVWDPTEGGTLYAVALVRRFGSTSKAILVQHTGSFATKLEMKHDRLPEGWQIADQRELIHLINQHPSQVGVVEAAATRA